MKAADVPCIPGWHPSTTGDSPSDPSVNTQSADFLILEADKIGYPVLIKAVSGGGGKGMKIVDKREDFASQLESAKREGKKSFGDDTVLLEKYVTKPRRKLSHARATFAINSLLSLSSDRRRGPDFLGLARQPPLPLRVRRISPPYSLCLRRRLTRSRFSQRQTRLFCPATPPEGYRRSSRAEPFARGPGQALRNGSQSCKGGRVPWRRYSR